MKVSRKERMEILRKKGRKRIEQLIKDTKCLTFEDVCDKYNKSPRIINRLTENNWILYIVHNSTHYYPDFQFKDKDTQHNVYKVHRHLPVIEGSNNVINFKWFYTDNGFGVPAKVLSSKEDFDIYTFIDDAKNLNANY